MNAERPQLIGLPTRIRLSEVIGSGSFCTVWKARDSQTGQDFAIKLLSVQSGGALAAERLEREARALSRLNKLAGAVSLHQVGITADGTAWLLLDFAPGGSLQDRLDATLTTALTTASTTASITAELEAEQALVALRESNEFLAASLFFTLAQAHESGVIHGDISPANVLFAESGKPLLADFGMAGLLGGGDGALGVVGFTPAYAAPERIRGGPPDQASDVYALAATLWHAQFGNPLGSARPQRSALPPNEQSELKRDWMQGALSELPAERPDALGVARSLSAPTKRHKKMRLR